MRSIVHYPNPILEIPCKEVTLFDKELWDLLDDMSRIMNNLKGLGIAANQIGESLRVIIIMNTKPLVWDIELINPVILKQDGNISLNEGCLSVPGQNLDIIRPEKVEVEYQNRYGEKIKTTFQGIEARALLHEMDHLNGIMFFQKVNRQKRKKMLSIYKKTSKLT